MNVLTSRHIKVRKMRSLSTDGDRSHRARRRSIERRRAKRRKITY